MHEEHSAAQTQPLSPPEKEEKPPAYVPPATQEKRRQSVFKYVTILFAAAFVLMFMTYMMERRQNEAVVDTLNQSVSGLRESISNMQSAQDIYEENRQLMDKLNELDQTIRDLEQQTQQLQSQLDAQSNAAKAMDWLWQINQAYVTYYYKTARELITQFEATGLVDALPKESVTGNGEPSPADRYQEIYHNLY